MKKRNKKRNKVLSIILATVLCVGVLAGCGNSDTTEKASEEKETVAETADQQEETNETEEVATSDSGETVKIRVWFPTTPDTASLFVAWQEGFFDEVFEGDNVEVEPLNFANGPAANEAFLAGELDVASCIGDQPILVGTQSGVDGVVVARTMRSSAEGIVVPEDSDIQSVEDLKGKKVSVYIGTSYQKVLLQDLADYGLTADDVELVNITENNSAIAALANGEVDAIFITGYPFLTAEENGVGRVIIDGSEHANYAFLQFSRSFYDTYPDLVEKYVKALRKAEKFIEENQEQAYQDIADYLNLDLEQVEKVVPSNDYILSLDDESKQDFYVTAEFMQEQGLITNSIEKETIDAHLSDLIDTIQIDE